MTDTRRTASPLAIVFATGAFVGFSLGTVTGALITDSHAAPLEDQPGFDCRTDGNRICGPTNDQGVLAGCYNDSGDLVAAWPCHVTVNPSTGDGDVYTSPWMTV